MFSMIAARLESCKRWRLEGLRAPIHKVVMLATLSVNSMRCCHRRSHFPTRRCQNGKSGGSRGEVKPPRSSQRSELRTQARFFIHGVDFPVPNLTRLVVEGATTSEYLRLTLDPKASEPFSWERVQLGARAAGSACSCKAVARMTAQKPSRAARPPSRGSRLTRRTRQANSDGNENF
jgi:hypothetical protein